MADDSVEKRVGLTDGHRLRIGREAIPESGTALRFADHEDGLYVHFTGRDGTAQEARLLKKGERFYDADSDGTNKRDAAELQIHGGDNLFEKQIDGRIRLEGLDALRAYTAPQYDMRIFTGGLTDIQIPVNELRYLNSFDSLEIGDKKNKLDIDIPKDAPSITVIDPGRNKTFYIGDSRDYRQQIGCKICCECTINNQQLPTQLDVTETDSGNIKDAQNQVRQSYKEKFGIQYFGFLDGGAAARFLSYRIGLRPVSEEEKQGRQDAAKELVDMLHANGISEAKIEGDKIILSGSMSLSEMQQRTLARRLDIYSPWVGTSSGADLVGHFNFDKDNRLYIDTQHLNKPRVEFVQEALKSNTNGRLDILKNPEGFLKGTVPAKAEAEEPAVPAPASPKTAPASPATTPAAAPTPTPGAANTPADKSFLSNPGNWIAPLATFVIALLGMGGLGEGIGLGGLLMAGLLAGGAALASQAFSQTGMFAPSATPSSLPTTPNIAPPVPSRDPSHLRAAATQYHATPPVTSTTLVIPPPAQNPGLTPRR